MQAVDLKHMLTINGFSIFEKFIKIYIVHCKLFVMLQQLKSTTCILHGEGTTYIKDKKLLTMSHTNAFYADVKKCHYQSSRTCT